MGIVGPIQYIPCRISILHQWNVIHCALVKVSWPLLGILSATNLRIFSMQDGLITSYQNDILNTLHMHTWRLTGTRGAAGVGKMMGSVK